MGRYCRLSLCYSYRLNRFSHKAGEHELQTTNWLFILSQTVDSANAMSDSTGVWFAENGL